MQHNTNNLFAPVFKVALLLMVVAGLSACSNDMSDLEQWVTETKSRPGGRIEELPVIPPYKPYEYGAFDGRSPFIADTETQREILGRVNDISPDPERPREYLEEFPLDALRMVGTIRPSNVTLALVQDADGLIHKVAAGNYIGQNHGRIVGVDDAEVQLIEIVADGLGGWMERPAALALGN
ncbi:MAG: pilus assembly protein PilP [Pseudomonadota bacterium]